MCYNPILNVDSYKVSHAFQYPQNTQYVSSYIESRGGRINRTVFFGLQMFLNGYLSKQFTRADVDEAEAFFKLHGEPFYKDGWEYILEKYDGYLPVYIEAVPEGSIIPTSNVLVQVINTDPRCFWLTSYIETALLRAVWYPVTVCTNSWTIKNIIFDNLVKTSDDPIGGINFKLHDFGARGASSFETAGIGGASHLVNFLGTDTVTGVRFAQRYYHETGMLGYSIPAAEHSTITSWGGPDYEIDAFRNMVAQFAKPGHMLAVVSDSYDIYNAVNSLWGQQLKEVVEQSGATVVVRPDSGNPVEVVSNVIEGLMDNVGYTINSKGYRVLPQYYRVIQGDGVNEDSISCILMELEQRKISGDNIAFGMGAALLQNLNRDNFKFAMKASAINVNGVWRDVWKDPITDNGKRSKRGRLALVYENGDFKTIRLEDLGSRENILQGVYKNGAVLRQQTFQDIRSKVGADFII